MGWVDRLFFRKDYEYGKLLAEFARSLTELSSLDDISSISPHPHGHHGPDRCGPLLRTVGRRRLAKTDLARVHAWLS